MTPSEFNSIATQVQREIFNRYFEDLNQQLRVPQADVDYSDRIAAIDEKISIFKTLAEPVFGPDAGGTPPRPFFRLPSDLYKLGTVVYSSNGSTQVELERLSRSSFYNIQKSPLTISTTTFPTYLYENGRLYVSPSSISTTGEINVDYLRTPNDPRWNFTIGTLGQYSFIEPTAANNPSLDFELLSSEQTTVIIKILFYAGLVIEDPTVIQVAAQQIQNQQQNSKS